MGGFTINGIGATDHFKKLKSLGVHECPRCHNQTEFFLELAKFKVDILFIPTVTLKTRYAVMCSRCDNGRFISDTLANKILNGGSCDVLFEDTETPRLSEDTAGQNALQGGGTKSLTDGTPASTFTCPYCHRTQTREGDFCAYCGKPAPAAEETPEPEKVSPDTCPSCGAKVRSGSVFCDRCGKKL